MKRLNLGCGYKYRPAWTNVDMHATGPEVQVVNLTKALPFSESEFEVVYHSHVLEHFERPNARLLLQECFRVLKPGGVLRVAVPDLEQAARAYLQTLEQSLASGDSQNPDHEWMIIELIDQLNRNRPGGELNHYVSRADLKNESFVVGRWGAEAQAVINGKREEREQGGGKISGLIGGLRLRLKQWKRYPFFLREMVLKLLLGAGYETWSVGRYRMSGDVHLWMYDQVSLARLLSECGFTGILKREAIESYVPEWSLVGLDTDEKGGVYRPSSLFMEALKPQVL